MRYEPATWKCEGENVCHVPAQSPAFETIHVEHVTAFVLAVHVRGDEKVEVAACRRSYPGPVRKPVTPEAA